MGIIRCLHIAWAQERRLNNDCIYHVEDFQKRLENKLSENDEFSEDAEFENGYTESEDGPEEADSEKEPAPGELDDEDDESDDEE